ncbi:MAG: phosphoribosyl-ATP diphosphatase, partial [Spirochaetia bacterium]|nr:phosphoribosyl-ATP diphosphatase [Spirochaetia bacterium]
MSVFESLFDVIENRKTKSPDDSYTAALMGEGTKKINAKIMEEAAETCE